MDSEKIVNNFLIGYGLNVEKFEKDLIGNIKSPDFKVYNNGELALFCEVKNAQQDEWLDKEIEQAPIGEIVVGVRKDPVFNRLTTHIHKARKQFDAVNEDEVIPNVLAFYNEDDNSGFLDLLAVTTGNYFAEDGSVFPVYKKFSDGRIKSDIQKIHLFVWLDKRKPHRFLFNTINSRYQNELCALFGFDPSNLELVRS